MTVLTLYKNISDCYFNYSIWKKLSDKGKMEDAEKFLQSYLHNVEDITHSPLNEKLAGFRFCVRNIITPITYDIQPKPPCNPSYLVSQLGIAILTHLLKLDGFFTTNVSYRDFPVFICLFRFDILMYYLQQSHRTPLNIHQEISKSFFTKAELPNRIASRVRAETNNNFKKLNPSSCECLFCVILSICITYEKTNYMRNFDSNDFKEFIKKFLMLQEDACKYDKKNCMHTNDCVCLHTLSMFKETTPSHVEVLLLNRNSNLTIRSCCLFCLIQEKRFDLIPTIMAHPYKDFNMYKTRNYDRFHLLDPYTQILYAWSGNLQDRNDKILLINVLNCFGRLDVLSSFVENKISINLDNKVPRSQIMNAEHGLLFKPYVCKQQMKEYMKKFNVQCVHSFDILNCKTVLNHIEKYIHFLYSQGLRCKQSTSSISPFTKKIFWGCEIEAICLLKHSLANINEQYSCCHTYVVGEVEYIVGVYEYLGLGVDENQIVYNTDCAMLSNQFNVLTYLLIAGAKFNHSRLKKYIELLDNPTETTHTHSFLFHQFNDSLQDRNLSKFNNSKEILNHFSKNPNSLSQLSVNTIRQHLVFPLSRDNFKRYFSEILPMSLESLFFLDDLDLNYVHPPLFSSNQKCGKCNSI